MVQKNFLVIEDGMVYCVLASTAARKQNIPGKELDSSFLGKCSWIYNRRTVLPDILQRFGVKWKMKKNFISQID